MGYRQALQKIEELHKMVELIEKNNRYAEMPAEVTNIALERIRRVFDMIEYEAEYEDADLGVIDYADGQDMQHIKDIFAEIDAQIALQQQAEAQELEIEIEGLIAETLQYNEQEEQQEEQQEGQQEGQEGQEPSYEAHEEYAVEQQEPTIVEMVEMVEPAGPERIEVERIVAQKSYKPHAYHNERRALMDRTELVQRDTEEADVQKLVASYNKRRSDRYRQILSLYVDTPIPQPADRPKPQELKEKIVEKAMERVVKIEKVEKLDINALLPEAFKELNDDGIELLTNELFKGDTKSFLATLLTIDEQASLEEAIFYIAENFVWDGDSDAAKLLFTLLQRRFA